ncbi:MAG: cyclodeaminase/cyclohydrolase family protein, partial [Clostridia bacterium]|nr:cyclodeaminase/cyclohydrolase family protein [Clostridia bacterium]
AVVFAPLAMAYKLPSTTEAEREAKAEELALAARDAALVPMEIAEKTFAAMEITKRISEIGTRLAISDAGCAMHFLKAALWSARYNVLINLPLVNDERFSKMTNDKLNYWFEEANKLFSETIENVEKYL